MIDEVYFFFSCRRRHTRFDCDWSSDVCSSDLQDEIGSRRDRKRERCRLVGHAGGYPAHLEVGERASGGVFAHVQEQLRRSEERRVGKESSTRRRQYHKKNKKR